MDYEQMEGFAGDKGEIDNVDQEICSRNDEEMDSVEIARN